jgi:predicted alpha/beta-hydrolase family hydrolase
MLLAPGAGAGSTSGWMKAWGDRLATLDLAGVEALDYPYRVAGRKAPDKLPVLIAAHRAALAAARAQHPSATSVVLAGKSMGGRVGCHVALEEKIDALVCFGYPLRSPTGTLRDQVLLDLRTPVLFIQGTRDQLCPLDLLNDVRQRMTAQNDLLVVDGGDHSLEVLRGRRRASNEPRVDPQDASDATVLQAVREFLARVL